MPWPNFFLAGAPKTGTTALYYALRQHPQIYLSPIREPAFFARADQEPRLAEIPEETRTRHRSDIRAFLAGPMDPPRPYGMVFDESDYLKLFARVRDERAIGEGSTGYFWQASAAAAIKAQVPHARLVFILRDPAERAFSQHLAAGYYDGTATFRERFRQAGSPKSKWAMWRLAGRYGTNLQRFYDLFPREQILVHLYDDFRADPGALVRSILKFLGVDAGVPIDISRRHNEPSVPRFPRLHALRSRLFGERALAQYFPEGVRGGLRRLYLRPRADVRMDPADRELVIDCFRVEVEYAARLIGRDLSHWLR